MIHQEGRPWSNPAALEARGLATRYWIWEPRGGDAGRVEIVMTVVLTVPRPASWTRSKLTVSLR
jgi:hypothetical protein